MINRGYRAERLFVGLGFEEVGQKTGMAGQFLASARRRASACSLAMVGGRMARSKMSTTRVLYDNNT